MSHDDAYNDIVPIRDAHTANEVRFLARGLQQLSIDPQAEVPADFHATVMAKARALPLPRPRWRERLHDRHRVRRRSGATRPRSVPYHRSIKAVWIVAPSCRRRNCFPKRRGPPYTTRLLTATT